MFPLRTQSVTATWVSPPWRLKCQALDDRAGRHAASSNSAPIGCLPDPRDLECEDRGRGPFAPARPFLCPREKLSARSRGSRSRFPCGK